MKLFLPALLAASLMAAPADECRKLHATGKRAEAKGCFQKLAASRDSWTRAEGLWGLGDFTAANDVFRSATAANPKNAEIKVRWGRFFHERFRPADATELFKEALAINEKYAGALLGLALIASEGFDKQAVDYAKRALEIDPKLVEAQELLAWLALEDSNFEGAVEESDKALKLSTNATRAMSVRAAIDLLKNKDTSEWFDRVKAINPASGEAYAAAAHFLILNRRYEEGILSYQKAIEIEPDLHEARSELGINQMRLGREKEARENLEYAYNARYDSPSTVNSLRLMDSYKNFQTFSTNNTVVKLDKREAELLKPYIEGELKRAINTFEEKYKVKLEQPVQIEVYPNHEDFAVRTLGMPGLGALGVTFGHVVAMDSPSGRPPGTFHWASTLWHELSHVFVLTATKHRVPRWFTEGMAVHEETAVSPDWGDRLDPQAIRAIREKRLLPVAQLDRGFVRPSYPAQVIVSYFQAGRICDYIAGKWGYSKLLEMMHSFAKSKSTPEVIEEHLQMKPEEFDKQFLSWLHEQTKATVEGFPQWAAKIKQLRQLSAEDKNDEIIKEGNALIELYPDHVETGSAYELVAASYDARKETAQAAAVLQRYSKAGGRNPVTLKKLATMQEQAGDKPGALATLARLIYIYPFDEELHKRLGDLALDEGITDMAIREYTAVVASKPLDQAASRFNLARALQGAKRTEEAKEQLLMALEAAPGYKPAQKMLLELFR